MDLHLYIALLTALYSGGVGGGGHHLIYRHAQDSTTKRARAHILRDALISKAKPCPSLPNVLIKKSYHYTHFYLLFI